MIIKPCNIVVVKRNHKIHKAVDVIVGKGRSTIIGIQPVKCAKLGVRIKDAGIGKKAVNLIRIEL